MPHINQFPTYAGNRESLEVLYHQIIVKLNGYTFPMRCPVRFVAVPASAERNTPAFIYERDEEGQLLYALPGGKKATQIELDRISY